MAVYFIQAGDGGPVKIGKAQDPQSRLVELQCGSHQELKIIRLIEGGYGEEAFLHRMFGHLRLRGEWFHFHADMLTAVPPVWIAPRTPIDDLIFRFGGQVQFRQALEAVGEVVSQQRVSNWVQRNSIPAWYFRPILEAAKHAGIEMVPEDMLLIAAAKRAA